MKRVAVAFAGRALCLAEVADNPWTRARGLLGRKDLPKGQGLWIKPCSSVHMMFMRFAIDVVYLARDGTVLKVCEHLRPFRLSLGKRGTRTVLELPAGSVGDLGIAVGQALVITPIARGNVAATPSGEAAGLIPRPPDNP